MSYISSGNGTGDGGELTTTQETWVQNNASKTLSYNDFFSNKSTDSNGDVSVTLSNTPTSDADVFIVCNNSKRVSSFQSRTGTSVVARLYKLNYDKASNPAGVVASIPSGVTVRTSTSGITTSSESSHTHAVDVPALGTTSVISSANQSVGINPSVGVGGLSADDATHTHTTDIDHNHGSFTSGVGSAHNHTFNELWDHGHTLTQTATDLPVASSESGLNILVIYK